MLYIFFLSVLCSSARADDSINIYADHMEYIAETNTYLAKGSVEIISEDAKLSADEIQFNKITSDAVAVGNVVFEDAEVILHADKVELNFDTKLGIVFNSKIFHKKGNYHIESKHIKKLGENLYYMDDASATTCDARPPAWYFRGKDIEIKLSETVTAKNTTFYIKNIPVLYSPYFHAPLERQTGMLIPSFGHSNTKGFTFKQGFFWAIKDNMDATAYLDYFSEKGFGKGIDYRYMLSTRTNGELWMYHVRDDDQNKDFFELKSYHNQKLPYDMSGYLKMHFVNEFNYYDELDSTSLRRVGLTKQESDPFGFTSEESLQKYLESSLQLSKPFSRGRTYALGQYRQSLEGSSGAIPQNLPEIGFIVNTMNLGFTSFNLDIIGTNFWREDGQQGQRLDVNPNIFFSFGRLINFTQKTGLRETLYLLKNPTDNLNRELFESQSTLTTRFFKRYSSFVHIIEPTVSYIYIPEVDQSDIPGFDSKDFIPQRSDITYAFTNRLRGSLWGGSEARLRFSQGYSLLDTDKPFAPVQVESTLSSRYLDVSANASYDVYGKSFTETIAQVYLRAERGYIGIGKNLRRSTNLDQYTLEAGLHKPVNLIGRSLPIDISAKLWYDVKGGGVQEFNLKSTYTKQCWAFMVIFDRKPFEYQILFGIEFKGFGSLKIG
jgi:LPS-assembly protein